MAKHLKIRDEVYERLAKIKADSFSDRLIILLDNFDKRGRLGKLHQGRLVNKSLPQSEDKAW